MRTRKRLREREVKGKSKALIIEHSKDPLEEDYLRVADLLSTCKADFQMRKKSEITKKASSSESHSSDGKSSTEADLDRCHERELNGSSKAKSSKSASRRSQKNDKKSGRDDWENRDVLDKNESHLSDHCQNEELKNDQKLQDEKTVQCTRKKRNIKLQEKIDSACSSFLKLISELQTVPIEQFLAEENKKPIENDQN